MTTTSSVPVNSGVLPITNSTEVDFPIAAAGSYDVVFNNVLNPCKADVYLVTGGANMLSTLWLDAPSKYNTHLGSVSVAMPAAGHIYVKISPVTSAQSISVCATVQGFTTP